MIPITTLIATREEIKALLGITANTYDTLIDLYNPILQDELLNQVLGNNFGAGFLVDGTILEPSFPNDLKLVMMELIKNQVTNKPSQAGNVTSFSLGDYSISFDVNKTVRGMDSGIYNNVMRYSKIYKDEPIRTEVD